MDLVGKRVSVRHRSADGARDVIGRVLVADAEGLRIERRDGRTAFVPAGTVVAMRVVPDRPLRRRRAASFSADELTRITSRGWPATESVRLGEWELRAAGGFTGRANSAAVHGDPGAADPFGAVVRFYRRRDLRPLAQVVEGSDWEPRFRAAGWVRVEDQPPGATVRVLDVDTAPEPDPAVAVADRADDDWLGRYGRVDDPALARAVMEGPPTVAFMSVGDVAIGRAVVTGEWAGVAAVEVDSAHRRTGLARRLVDTSLAWAVSHGADKVYVQTMRGNTAADALFESYGFTPHHAYGYFTPS